MKKIVLLLMFVVLTLVADAQIVDSLKTALEGFGWEMVITVVLGLLASVFASKFVSIQKRLKAAGELLIQFSNAIDDRKIDANERKDLSAKAKELFGK